jgi:hypothetical protein
VNTDAGKSYHAGRVAGLREAAERLRFLGGFKNAPQRLEVYAKAVDEQEAEKAPVVPVEQLKPLLAWMRSINTPDVAEFLGQLTALEMRKQLTRLESLGKEGQ